MNEIEKRTYDFLLKFIEDLKNTRENKDIYLKIIKSTEKEVIIIEIPRK